MNDLTINTNITNQQEAKVYCGWACVICCVK